jgi:hypothetical protein
MTLPPAVQAVWNELQAVRGEVLNEVSGTSQLEADWRPGARDWSVGELIHHLTLAEIHTGKLTTKLIKEGQRSGILRPFPEDLRAFTPLPPPPPGPAEAPLVVRPEHGHPIDKLIEEMKAVNPRPLTWKHFAFGALDLAQWWILQARHDRIHLEQMRAVKAAPGFPRV